ncbi:MAG: sialidase family protein, partial [Planctomycetota bacterium]
MIVPNLFLFSGLAAAAGVTGKPFFEKRVVLARRQRGALAIPKLVVTSGDTATIVAQDRQGGDWGKRIDPIFLRSTDGGRSWSKPSLLIPPDFPGRRESICKPTGVVVNRRAGKVLVFISRSPLRNREGGTVHERWFYSNIQETRALGRSWFIVESADDGETWSRPREVLDQLIVKPHWQEWSPVHKGIELARGAHVGRLVVPVRCYCPDSDPSRHDWRFQSNGVIYSDDGGATWTPGGRSDPRLGECSIAELGDGAILMNQ